MADRPDPQLVPTRAEGSLPVAEPYPPFPDLHLRDELTRISLLIRGFLVRHAPRPDEQQPVRPSDSTLPAACQAVLNDPFRWTEGPATDLGGGEVYLAEAARQELHIIRRLRATREDVRSNLRAWELARRFDLVPNLQLVVPNPHSEIQPTNVARDTLALDVVLLTMLLARMPRYWTAIASVVPESSQRGFTLDVALQILQPFASPADYRWQEFSPTGPLLAHQLVSLGLGDVMGQRTIEVDFRVATFLAGKEPPPDPLLGDAVQYHHKWRDWESVRLDTAVVEQLRRLSTWWWQNRQNNPLVTMLHGPWGAPFLEALQAFLTCEIRTPANPTPTRRAWPVLLVEVSRTSRTDDWAEFVARVYREANLRRAVVFWTQVESLITNPDGRWAELIRRAEQASVSTFLASQIGWDPIESFRLPQRYFVRIDLPTPAPPIRRKVWKSRLAREKVLLAADATPADQAALDLLQTFEFTQGEIEDAIATARGLALVAPLVPRDKQAEQWAELLSEGCRRQAARRPVSFAQRIPPHLTSEEREVPPREVLRRRVVLPAAASHQLAELFDRISHMDQVYHDLGFGQRLTLGRGIVALFTGSPGTGKTLSATMLAKLLQKDLYKVDASAVASRFVGETEKNLGRVFADVQGANAILFFDEADALFGKRGEVVQAADRWANLQISYLLQRIEEYSGTVILATNYRNNIDPAFFRRVQVLIEFPRPDAASRLNILEGLFAGTHVAIADANGQPAQTSEAVRAILKPITDRFDLSGGSLKNVALDAAFRAVAGNQSVPTVTVREILLGIAREMQKEGKPITMVSFGKEWFGLVEKELRLTRE